jgi:hypothetical protein
VNSVAVLVLVIELSLGEDPEGVANILAPEIGCPISALPRSAESRGKGIDYDPY